MGPAAAAEPAAGLRPTAYSQPRGQQLQAGAAFVRDLMHIADGFCYIGFILAAFDDKAQTFADKWKHTVVVSR
jgi:uncharacterized RDD family membrane protein YckC